MKDNFFDILIIALILVLIATALCFMIQMNLEMVNVIIDPKGY